MIDESTLNVQRKIIHVDMDCFYAAVEVRDNPNLKGKPVAVGGSAEGRGVIATANYEARKYGIKSAMPTRTALKKCANLILVSGSFAKYKHESKRVMEIFKSFTDKIEPLSLDEAYLDVTDCELFEGSATLIAQEIRKTIFSETQLTASAGIAPNKFLAKVASEWRKPNGQFTVAPMQVPQFVKSLPVKKIPGVGPVATTKLNDLGFFTCFDLQNTSKINLIKLFGKWGPRLHELSFGRDLSEVSSTRVRKSLSVEHTFREDSPNIEAMEGHVVNLYAELSKRWENFKLRQADQGDTVSIKGCRIKLKFNDFTQLTREMSCHSLPKIDKFRSLLANVDTKKPIRLLGMGLKLNTNKQDDAQLELNL